VIYCGYKVTDFQSQEKEKPMSLNRRIEELNRRHSQLDEKINEEQKRPSADVTVLKDLKRQKLRLKEEIGMLRAS
jgi:hypothetical protein